MKLLPACLLAAVLAGCGPLVQIGGNSPAPESLLTLLTTRQPVAGNDGPVDPRATTGIEVPAVPSALQTLRLPVMTSYNEISYLAGATWAEQPNRQFQRLLADTLTAAGIPVIDQRQSNLAPARRLTGTLREFGLDVRDPSAPVVRVRYDAQLAEGSRVALRRFDASAPVASQTPVAVAAALNTAANQVAADVATWATAAARP